MIKCPKCGCKKIMGMIQTNDKKYWVEVNLSKVYEPCLKVSDYVNCFDCSYKWQTGGRLK